MIPRGAPEVIANAKIAMTFLKEFGANHLVVFLAESQQRNRRTARFKAMCESFNEIGAAAREMGFHAGLHNHMGEMVQTRGRNRPVHGDDRSEALLFFAGHGASSSGRMRRREDARKIQAPADDGGL